MLSNLHKLSKIILKQNCEIDALLYPHFKDEITEVEKTNMHEVTYLVNGETQMRTQRTELQK